MGFQNHADIISSISNSQRYRMFLGCFDQLHYLKGNEREQVQAFCLLTICRRTLEGTFIDL